MTAYGPDSFYFPKFFTADEAKNLYTQLQQELVYVPRDQITFNIFGKTIPLPRDKAFFGDVTNDSYPLYRYSGNDDYPAVKSWTTTTRKIRDHLKEKTGQYCNHLVANRYRNQKDHIGYHRDKTRDFVDSSDVLTVSFGATRKFQLLNLESKVVETLNLEHGSLFILGTETNDTYKHRICKTTVTCDERISLTYRSIKTLFYPHTDTIGESQ
jgi:alkylated DNA repair dioxygenase AlkB